MSQFTTWLLFSRRISNKLSWLSNNSQLFASPKPFAAEKREGERRGKRISLRRETGRRKTNVRFLFNFAPQSFRFSDGRTPRAARSESQWVLQLTAHRSPLTTGSSIFTICPTWRQPALPALAIGIVFTSTRPSPPPSSLSASFFTLEQPYAIQSKVELLRVTYNLWLHHLIKQ